MDSILNSSLTSGSIGQTLNMQTQNLVEEQIKNMKDARSFQQILDVAKKAEQDETQITNTRDLSSIGKMDDMTKKEREKMRMEATAQDFESVFISQMLKPMFESVDVDPMFGGGNAEDVFRGLLVQEYGKNLAEGGGLGFKDALMQQFKIYQEGSIQ